MSKVAWIGTVLAGWLACAGAQAGERHYYYTDPQGTVLAKADAAGNIIETSDYRPYGARALGPAENGPGYTGHVNDADSGLVYMQARYYDPVVGRFLSVDPVGPSLGGLLNFGRYSYVNNNPIVNTDPTGMHAASESDDVCMGNQECRAGGAMAESRVAPNASVSKSPQGSRVPAGTPATMVGYFSSSDPLARAYLVMAILKYYKIDSTGITCCSFVSGADYNALMYPSGELAVGAPLFSYSFGMMGAILYHEVGVHWQIQYRTIGLDTDISAYTQAWYMREVQAYDLETSPSSITRFGLTSEEVKQERAKRGRYLRFLLPANKELVEKGVYEPVGNGL